MENKEQILREKLTNTCNTPEMDAAMANVAIELAENYKGTPQDFVTLVKDKVKADYPEHKFSADGGYTAAATALKEFISSADTQSGESSDQSKQSSDNLNNDESTSSNDKGTSAADKTPDSPKTKTAAKSEMITVRLNQKISGYGGGQYDRETKTLIKGKDPVKVKNTLFIKRAIKNQQLIEVK